MARPCNPLNLRDAMKRYMAGHGHHEIARELHVSPRTLLRRLKAAGIKMRSRSEAHRAVWNRMSPTKRERRAREVMRGAQAASRGRTVSIETKSKCAAAWEGRLRGRDVAMHEPALAEHLAGLGVRTLWQHAVGPYNVDLALEERRVAVEVQRGNWTLNVKPGRVLAKKRLEYILDAGWSVLVIYCPALRKRKLVRGHETCLSVVEQFDGRAVAEKIISLLNVPGVFPAGGGQHGVIDGYAKPAPIVRLDLDGRPVIPGL